MAFGSTAAELEGGAAAARAAALQAQFLHRTIDGDQPGSALVARPFEDSIDVDLTADEGIS